MAATIFILCAATSVVCLGLLVRGYRRSRGRLIMWTAICFAGLAVNNVLLAIDKVALTHTDLSWRGIPAALGLCALVYGLVAEEATR